jgi:hypothetical protein
MLLVWIRLQKSEADILAEAALSWILADAGVNAGHKCLPHPTRKNAKIDHPNADHSSFRHHS